MILLLFLSVLTIHLCAIVHGYCYSLHFPISEKSKTSYFLILDCFILDVWISVFARVCPYCFMFGVWWANIGAYNGSLTLESWKNPSIRPVHFFICPYGDGMNRKWHAFLLSDSKINLSVHFLQRRWEERKEVKWEKNRSRGNKEWSVVKLKRASLLSGISAVIRWILVW